jgi:cytochrome c6
MKKTNIQMFATVTAVAVALVVPLSVHAQGAADLYKPKCAPCHGPDGTGSATGKKLGAHDFQTAEVQKMPDSQIADVITNGKNKMPAYGKSLKPEDIKGLVSYIRSLAK